ncbi:hypothetical protein [Nocardioides sp. CER19]|uniref:hypothetical protein n=1 Tax=Nocardioides sp. CER19 TaxID=3038538 RepID=UPI0024488D8B|nr:hypothetical protein [Nocardioides sp. CER19]MDH2415789.1 hypothetical protein [Nocardioides sp. CER19]
MSTHGTGQDAQIAAAITAQRMERIDTCEWASPAVRDVLAEYAADLRASIPLSVGLDRIRRAIEADRAERRTAEQTVRLVS